VVATWWLERRRLWHTEWRYTREIRTGIAIREWVGASVVTVSELARTATSTAAALSSTTASVPVAFAASRLLEHRRTSGLTITALCVVDIIGSGTSWDELRSELDLLALEACSLSLGLATTLRQGLDISGSSIL
jgi:hypothetical protein